MTKPKHPGGRPTKFNEERAGKILLALRAGNYLEASAAFAGVHKDTVYEWIKRGKRRTKKGKPFKGDEALAEFSDGVEMAKAAAEVRMVGIINKAAMKSWQAAAWYLERTNNKRWGRSQTHKLADPDGNPLKQTEHNTTVIYLPDNNRDDTGERDV
jgi:hypothetical protein